MGAERALKVLAGRWKLVILWHLLERSRRLCELELSVPGISQKVLIHQLREMEAHGLVLRSVQATVPARVDYAVTPLARSLRPLILDLCAWGRRHEAATAPRPHLAGVSRR